MCQTSLLESSAVKPGQLHSNVRDNNCQDCGLGYLHFSGASTEKVEEEEDGLAVSRVSILQGLPPLGIKVARSDWLESIDNNSSLIPFRGLDRLQGYSFPLSPNR